MRIKDLYECIILLITLKFMEIIGDYDYQFWKNKVYRRFRLERYGLETYNDCVFEWLDKRGYKIWNKELLSFKIGLLEFEKELGVKDNE